MLICLLCLQCTTNAASVWIESDPKPHNHFSSWYALIQVAFYGNQHCQETLTHADMRYTCYSASNSWGTQPHVLSRSSQAGQTTRKCLLCRALAVQMHCSCQLRGSSISWLKSKRIGVFTQKLIYLLIRIEIIPYAVPGTVKCHFTALKAALKPSRGVSPSFDVDEIRPYFLCYLWSWILLGLERMNLYSAITSVYGWILLSVSFCCWCTDFLFLYVPLGSARNKHII